MRSSCTASGPANPRDGDRTRDLHGFSAAVLQHTSSGPLWQSRCALRSTVPAHAGCPHTVPAHNGPSLPCKSLARLSRACSAAASCAARCPHTGSLESPSAWLPRCPRAVLLMDSSLAARGSACPHTGPLQLRLLVLLKCNSFNRNTVLRDGRPKIGMTATPSRNRNRKHPAGTGP